MADSIREALTAAYADENKEAPEVEVEASPEPVVDATPEVTPEVAEPAKDAAPEPAATVEPPAAEKIDPPPGSWKPSEKSHWDKLPADVRAAVKRREAETSRAFQQTADARKAYDTLGEIFTPYVGLMQRHGIRDPLREIVQPLIQTRAALEAGTPEQKAALLVQLIDQFKVDTDVMNEIYNDPKRVPGQNRHAAPPPPQPVNFREIPELAPLFGLAEQVTARRQQQARAEIEKIASDPNFEDLREDTADILEKAARRGEELSIEEAYRRAAIVSGKQPLPAAPVSPSEAAAILAKSRNAASSVAGAPKAVPAAKPQTLREELAAAFADAM